VKAIAPDLWFFEGHFKNDPCMPGTLMLEGAVQALAFFMAALGCTVRRDGWRFEPAKNENMNDALSRTVRAGLARARVRGVRRGIHRRGGAAPARHGHGVG
jgi:3-hydroxymyristoyl/3-hydroxydecanoyl-(acyl carrier protein) dehydratase